MEATASSGHPGAGTSNQSIISMSGWYGHEHGGEHGGAGQRGGTDQPLFAVHGHLLGPPIRAAAAFPVRPVAVSVQRAEWR